MNVLVIAPEHADLPNASVEIAAIKRHHHATIVPGPVRDRDIARAVEEGPFDIIWWISHGSANGVLLSDGLLSIAGVGQYVGASAAHLCILNTCDSEDVAQAIIAGGIADMICTIGPVTNSDAIRLGSLLAGELAHSDSYYNAYEIVAPADGPYRYLRAKAQFRRSDAFMGELRDIDRRALADRTRMQIMILTLTAIVLLGGIGLYRETLTVEANQAKVLADIHELEGRIIELQLQHYSYTPPPFGDRK